MDIIEKYKKNFPGAEYFSCWHGMDMLFWSNGSEALFHGVCKAEILEDYEFYAKNTEGDVNFVSFTNGKVHIHISYAPFENVVRLIRDKDSSLPPVQKKSSAVTGVKTLVTQMRHRFFAVDCAMTYVIRMGDGRFAIIDGGMGEDGEAGHILELLEEQNVLEGKPQIAVWFFTHAHEDHYYGFVKFIKKFRHRVELDSLAYNWPVQDIKKPYKSMLVEALELLEDLNEVKTILCHSGQQFIYEDVQFDVLYSYEDLYPVKVTNFNDTSLIMRMTICDKRIMWLGDAMPVSSEYVSQKYPDESLRCDILQVAHHGYRGGTPSLYKKIDPQYLFWPVPSFRLDEVKQWESNLYLTESPHIRDCFVAGVEETTVDMEEMVVLTAHPSEKKEIIYQADLNDKNPYYLEWSNVNGKGFFYNKFKLNFAGNGECHLTLDEGIGALELVRADFMQGHDSYIFLLEGKILEGAKKLGIMWNYTSVTKWDEDQVLWLPEATGQFSFLLKADVGIKKASAYFMEECIANICYEPAKRHGIYLVSDAGKICISKVQVLKKGE